MNDDPASVVGRSSEAPFLSHEEVTLKKATLHWVAAIAGACLGIAVVAPRLAHSADHLDGPEVKKDPATDINDVYTFTDGNNAVFVMTVFPAASATSKFSDKAAYVLHTASAGTFGPTSNDLDVICTFDAAQKASCWAGDEYVTGDASQAGGITSASGKMKVFAGLRSDPFFFNLEGFNQVVSTVTGAAGGLTFDDAGCPTLDQPTSDLIVNTLKQSADGGAPQDFFKDLKTLAIVVSLDKSLVTKGGKLVTVWASTNMKQ